MYRRILVPLDGSPLAEAALGQLAHLAGPDTEVILLRVIGDEPMDLPPSVMAPASAATSFAGVVPPVTRRSDPGDSSTEGYNRSREVAQRYLQEKAESLGAGAKRRLVVLPDVDPARVISSEATAEDVDLIVMSTHGRSGVVRWVLGSVAEKVLHSTHRPLLLVRADKPSA